MESIWKITPLKRREIYTHSITLNMRFRIERKLFSRPTSSDTLAKWKVSPSAADTSIGVYIFVKEIVVSMQSNLVDNAAVTVTLESTFLCWYLRYALFYTDSDRSFMKGKKQWGKHRTGDVCANNNRKVSPLMS